jgi:hypothetical protein
MIELAPSDFVSLDTFPLGWRFAPERVGSISSTTLARIRALSADRAAAFAHGARERCEEAARFAVTFRSDESPGVVRAQLQALPPHPATGILISWDARTAVASDWEVFVAHWDDFCYPSSDDVTMWPLDDGWTLCYRHYEIFQFDSRLRAV